MRKEDDVRDETLITMSPHGAHRSFSKTIKEEREFEAESSVRDRLLAEAQANRRLLASLIDSDWLGLELLAEIGTSSSFVHIQDLERDTNILPTLKRLVDVGLLEERYGKYACTKLGREILTKTEELTGVSMDH